jgi:hypothetical protein
MLPEDTKARRAALLEETLHQTEVDERFTKQKLEDWPQPYSDKLFEEVAIQWLIETDQVRRPMSSIYIKPELIKIMSLAYTGVSTPDVQENDRRCSSRNTRSEYSWRKTNSRSYCQNIQGANEGSR